MLNIKVYNYAKTTSVTLPKKAMFTTGAKVIEKTTTMASGKLVVDVIGIKPTMEVTFGYIPASDMVTLKTILNEGGLQYVEFPDVEADRAGYYKIDYPEFTTFKYDDDGVAIWTDVKLSMVAQEVL